MDDWLISISDVVSYKFCPRLIYFMHCLGIHENTNYDAKVIKGKNMHEQLALMDDDFFKNKFNVIKTVSEVYLVSKRYHIKGILDNVLFFPDNIAAPFEYKFSEYKNFIYLTYKYQLALQSLLIHENYGLHVNKGYICYLRSDNLVKEIDIEQSILDESVKSIYEIYAIIVTGKFPDTSFSNKCYNCYYNNICQ